MITNYSSECLDVFKEITKKTSPFLQANEDFNNEIRTNLKKIYDFTKNEEIKTVKSNALRELVEENFDLEQIWQQVELQNDSVLNPALTIVSKLVVNKSKLLFQNEDKIEENVENTESEDAQDEISEEKSESEEENLDDLDFDSEKDEDETGKVEKKVKPSIVDDDFFKLNEMEKFLVSEEKKETTPDSGNDSENSEDEESVDLFEVSDEEGGEMAKYKDFFVQQESKKIKKNKHIREIEDEADDDEDDDDENQPSTHELKQQRLNKKIERLEAEAIAEKPWRLKGEITADNRPQDSLLQEILEFDLTTRPAPVITEQTTMQLEDIIKQRIKDKTFDSVERKAKPVDTPLEYKKKLVLDQEKSKESLAQIYEKEFLNQQAAKDSPDREQEEPQLHKEINVLLKDLFVKLDALSNFHFTPRPAIPEVKIISNLPAIAMEEVAPVAASDAMLLAPEEVKAKSRGDLMGKNERTATDKKRERRKKKLKQKIHAKEKEKGNVMGQKAGKEKGKKKKGDQGNSSDAQALKSSKAFFTQLEEEVKTQIKRKSSNKLEKKDGSHNAKKLKL